MNKFFVTMFSIFCALQCFAMTDKTEPSNFDIAEMVQQRMCGSIANAQEDKKEPSNFDIAKTIQDEVCRVINSNPDLDRFAINLNRPLVRVVNKYGNTDEAA